MASIKIFSFLLLFFGVLGVSMSAVYQVGNGEGWNANETDYESWATSIKFHVNDSIVFNYDPKFHNVVEVGKEEYNKCSDVSPIATYTCGRSEVNLNSTGYRYFICSFPGMCQAGQKVKIHVIKSECNGQDLCGTKTPAQVIDSNFTVEGVYPYGWGVNASSSHLRNSIIWFLIVFVAFYLH